jgi:predicted RNA polymerase sigma factor
VGDGPGSDVEARVAGLLALMLLTDARRAACTNAHGHLVPLAEQDRTRWDNALIAAGSALIDTALTRPPLGPYQLQAAVAARHDHARDPADTDWQQIAALYTVLDHIAPNPAVTLNRAVALAVLDGPAAGLRLLTTPERHYLLARAESNRRRRT